MAPARLHVVASAWLLVQAAALKTQRRNCPEFTSIVHDMKVNTSDRITQLTGCRNFARCTDSSKVDVQNKAVAAGSLEAAIGAMQRFPDDKEVQVACTNALARPSLFNRENGLRAGRLGVLNYTMAAYSKWIDDPKVNTLGGAVGAFLDWCNENRAILRELGGVHLLIQNIKNHFHGKYSDWGYEPVKQSLFGLSSGCWRNQDICAKEGFVDLAVRLMNEHTSETKIAEETLQAVKALMKFSNEYRLAFGEAGLAKAIVKVIRENPTDRGALSLACHSLAMFVGPVDMNDPVGLDVVHRDFEPRLQALATEAGAVEEMIATVTSKTVVQHHEHGAFSFDVDEAYNSDADCLWGLRAMAQENKQNQQKIARAGLVADLAARATNQRTRGEVCQLARLLAAGGETVSFAAAGSSEGTHAGPMAKGCACCDQVMLSA
eukprot:CAMPEP_0171107274 /NCGR_PEP_ID=MMETSP0766_2-20121228/66457_1 /TAXON_ID=439317 /ORGANISM="Gambierdiscus australes, Strain CAWD 149" /LENGTH=433 /DNA_ID=CAMNT_0011568537 /DNA_START=30 /DNA_END=1328 /DNA_ORIENTATION=-